MQVTECRHGVHAVFVKICFLCINDHVQALLLEKMSSDSLMAIIYH